MAERVLAQREPIRSMSARAELLHTTARLTSPAGVGETLLGRAAVEASGFDPSGLESPALALRGRAAAVEAVVARD